MIKARTLLAIFLFAPALFAQRQELGLMLGGYVPSSRGDIDINGGMAFYANYGIRLKGGERRALFLEVPFVASPQRTIDSANRNVTRDIATLMIAPGLRMKFAPKSRLSPYIAAGGGLAWFEQSTTTLSGARNGAPRNTYTGVFQFGAGADLRVWKWFGLRGEIRDFISGNPSFNTPVSGRVQNNVLVSGGFVLYF